MKENFHVEKILSLQGFFFNQSWYKRSEKRYRTYPKVLANCRIILDKSRDMNKQQKTNATPVVKEKLWVSVQEQVNSLLFFINTAE